MRKIIEEAIFSIKNKLHLYFIICFFNILLVGIIIFTINLLSIETFMKSNYENTYEDIHYYSSGDNFEDEGKKFFNDENWLSKLKVYNKMMHETDEFTYMEIYDQPIYISDDFYDEKFLDGYEYGIEETDPTNIKFTDGNSYEFYSVKCTWVSPEVFTQFSIIPEEGRLFTEEEYNYEIGEDSVVILGAEYSEYYDVGDVIHIAFPFCSLDINVEVIGILPEGTNVYKGTKFYNLDRSVIIPHYNVASVPKDQLELTFQKCLYLDKNFGVIATKISANDAQEIINNYCNQIGIYPCYYIGGATNQENITLGTNLQEIVNYTKNITFIIVIFFSIFTILYCWMKVKWNSKYFAILLMNGFSLYEISIIIIIEIVSIYMLSGIFGIPLGFFICLALGIIPRLSWLIIPFLLTSCMIPIILSIKRFYSMSVNELLKS